MTFCRPSWRRPTNNSLSTTFTIGLQPPSATLDGTLLAGRYAVHPLFNNTFFLYLWFSNYVKHMKNWLVTARFFPPSKNYEVRNPWVKTLNLICAHNFGLFLCSQQCMRVQLGLVIRHACCWTNESLRDKRLWKVNSMRLITNLFNKHCP